MSQVTIHFLHREVQSEKKMGVLQAILMLSYLSLVAYSQTCSEFDADVLILGGGLTGVSAANKLAELGITNFIILESQDRLGGRMRTEELVPGVNVNVGANWIQGVDRAEPRLHPLFDLAVRCGGVEGMYSDYDSIITYYSNGSEVNDSALRYDAYESAVEDAVELASNLQSSGDPDISVREGLTRGGWIPTTIEDNYVEWFEFDFCLAESPDISSLFAGIGTPTYSDFLADPDNDAEDYYITDNKGFPALIQCLADNFSTNPNMDECIHLETVVTQIEYSDECVCVTTNENGGINQYCAPYAIVTFSVGVIKQGSSTLFSPALPPAKVNALNFIVTAFYFIVFAEFNERFWDDYQYIGHIHPDRGYFPVIQILPQSFGVNATAMHVAEDLAIRLTSLSDDDLKAEITEVFRGIYGDNVTEPNRVLTMRWGTDPSFLGSYSNVRIGGSEMFSELKKPEGRMYLAGEATNRYSGFTHGAYLSGIDTANAVHQQKNMSSGSKVTGNIMLVLIIAAYKMTM